MGNRFNCPSSVLSLKKLLGCAKAALWWSLALALGMHLSFLAFSPGREEVKAVKPLTTKFLKREPRLVKPLELKKRPMPKPRPMRRKVVTVKAKISRRDVFQSTAQPLKVLDSLAKPKGGVVRAVSFEPAQLEGYYGSAIVEGDKEPEDKVDMALEMLDITSLDTGRYRAMIIRDPRDKKKIRGYFHFVIIYSETLRDINWHETHARLVFGLRRIVKALNEYSMIKADVIGTYDFDSAELFKTPWVYVASVTSFQLDDSELMNLGKYMVAGGFLFADTCHNMNETRSAFAEESLRKMIIQALETQSLLEGRDWAFEKIPKDHPLYHCFFDFNDGPPMGADWKRTHNNILGGPYPFLEGVTVDGRMYAILSRKGMGHAWSDWGLDGAGARQGHSDYAQFDPTRSLQFGVNVVIFALTQEGSITQQVMNYVE